MPLKLDYDRVAIILVEAVYYGDIKTAERWGITERTIQNYRNKLDNDPELSGYFVLKKRAFETEWANELPAAIRSALRFIVRAGEEADPKNPEAIHAMAGALKIVAEVGLTKDIIDARIGRYDRPDGEESRQVASLIEAPAIRESSEMDAESGATGLGV